MQYDIDKIGMLRYNILRAEIYRHRKNKIFIGVWLSLVECLVRDQEAGGSNPLTPTREKGSNINISEPFFIVNTYYAAGEIDHARIQKFL